MNRIFYSKVYLSMLIAIIAYTSLLCAYMVVKPREPFIKNRFESEIDVHKDLDIKSDERLNPYMRRQSDKRTTSSALKSICLPLRLAGVFIQGQERVACIEDLMTAKTGEYKIGDKLAGATLAQILSSEVLLVKDGQRIVLSLTDSRDQDSAGEWIAPLSRDCFVVNKRQLGRRLRNVNQLLEEMVPVVHVADGRIDGFRISALKKGGLINQAGFKEGDVIKNVNGCSIDSVKKPLQVYSELRSLVSSEEPLIKIEFERDNKSHTFSYRILRD